MKNKSSRSNAILLTVLLLLSLSFAGYFLIPRIPVEKPSPKPTEVVTGTIVDAAGKKREVTRPLTEQEHASYENQTKNYLSYMQHERLRKSMVHELTGFSKSATRLVVEEKWYIVGTLLISVIILRGFRMVSAAHTPGQKKQKEKQPEQLQKQQPEKQQESPKEPNNLAKQKTESPQNTGAVWSSPIKKKKIVADIEGRFKQFSQTAFIQMLSLNGESGTLQLTGTPDASRAYLYIYEGQIINAKTELATGEEAAMTILLDKTYDDFKFFKQDEPDCSKVITSSTMALLLEAQRLQDEQTDNELVFDENIAQDLDWKQSEEMLSSACSDWVEKNANDTEGSE